MTFDFGIPAVLELPEARARGDEREPEAEHQLDGVDVLIVDDDSEACEAVKMLLEHHGATVHTAMSAADALRALPDVNPDVLIADLAMPELDGYGLIKEVRKQPGTSRLPAIALTAYTEEAKDAALDAGFQQFTSKPVAPVELVTIVRRLSKRAVH